MKPSTINVAAGAQLVIIPLDVMIAPFQVTVALESVVSTVSVGVDVTYSELNPPVGAAAPVWIADATFTAKAAPYAQVFTTPCTGIRINKSGAGTCVVRVIQSGK